MTADPVPLTAPMERLRLPDTPRIGCEVRFRPYGKPLDHASYWNRWAFTDGRFESTAEPDRALLGWVKAIKRKDGGFYYRVISGVTAWDASPHETALYRKGK
jgi:hypothetical protein